jgi:hypothetical protein
VIASRAPRRWLVAVLGLLGVLFLVPPLAFYAGRPRSAVDHHPPRATPYLRSMKPVSSAEVRIVHLARGLRQVEIHHSVIEGVSPGMLTWWFQSFPERTAEVGGETIPWYQLWHPVDHIRVTVLREGTPGVRGLSPGAVIEIHEQLGSGHYLPSVFDVEKLDETGLIISVRKGRFRPLRLEHRFTAVPEGTRYHSRLVIGIDLPVLGHYLNFLIARLLVTDEFLAAWIRHNIEEVGNFQFFLPALHARHAIAWRAP